MKREKQSQFHCPWYLPEGGRMRIRESREMVPVDFISVIPQRKHTYKYHPPTRATVWETRHIMKILGPGGAWSSEMHVCRNSSKEDAELHFTCQENFKSTYAKSRLLLTCKHQVYWEHSQSWHLSMSATFDLRQQKCQQVPKDSIYKQACSFCL